MLRKMKIVGLISGGKDSIYNMLQCIAAGHEIVALANVEPVTNADEMDSFMYQTVGHETISLISEAIGLPVYRHGTGAIAVFKEKNYIETAQDEVEDLYKLLEKVKDEIHIDAVSVGAIASDYQRIRVENVCMRLNLKCFAYLWKRDQAELLQEMIDAEMEAVIIKVASLGLNPDRHLEMKIRELQPHLHHLNEKFGVNICGEGGEYETLTLDCPLYHRKIEITESEKVIHSDDAFAPVGYLRIKKANLKEKQLQIEKSVSSAAAKVDYIKSLVKSPIDYVWDCCDDGHEKFTETHAVSNVAQSPFGFTSRLLDCGSPSKTAVSDDFRRQLSAPTVSQHQVYVLPPSPSILPNIGTAIVQFNQSSGWCYVGNITASNIKEGMSIVQKCLDVYKYEMRDIVSVCLFVRDMGEWSKINEMYSQSVPNNCPPTRTCTCVPLSNDVGLIVAVVAHRLVSETQNTVHRIHHTVDKDVLHVRSISHWAPANIGPYSQCIRVGEIVYVAGQIPLIPGAMELLNVTPLQQCQLALRHVFRILKAMSNSYTMANVMFGVCFVTCEEMANQVLEFWTNITQNEHASVAVVTVLSLPKNAQLEWKVIACGYNNPQVFHATDTIGDFIVRSKTCSYPDHYISALVCSVSNAKKDLKKGTSKSTITPGNVTAVIEKCLHCLRQDVGETGTQSCMFNIFYKVTETSLAPVLSEALKKFENLKVVISLIPVIACHESDIFLTITGVCH